MSINNNKKLSYEQRITEIKKTDYTSMTESFYYILKNANKSNEKVNLMEQFYKNKGMVYPKEDFRLAKEMLIKERKKENSKEVLKLLNVFERQGKEITQFFAHGRITEQALKKEIQQEILSLQKNAQLSGELSETEKIGVIVSTELISQNLDLYIDLFNETRVTENGRVLFFGIGRIFKVMEKVVKAVTKVVSKVNVFRSTNAVYLAISATGDLLCGRVPLLKIRAFNSVFSNRSSFCKITSFI